jgi:amidase
MTASEAAAAVRAGTVRSQDLVEALLARIAHYNSALNAIVTLEAEKARQQAVAADEAVRLGQPVGPLHGVPFTVKDSFETAGTRTTAGYPPFAQRVPASDAPPVAQLRRAGAILLGKTNLPTLASGIQTDNSIFGRTNNPWDLTRTPGGSSGGAAAAVAAGLTYLEVGSDIGGSIRIPAHFCGVYGLKPTGGRISGKGHLASPKPLALPPGWEPLLQLAAFGPLARSVEDLRLALTVINGPQGPALAPAPDRTLRGLRLAWTDDFGGAPLDTASRQGLTSLAGSLEQAGCNVERPTASIDFDEAWYVAGVCLAAINTLFQAPLTRWLRQLGAPLLSYTGARHPLTRGLYAGLALNARGVQDALARRECLIEQLENFLSDWDAWLCPVFPTPAFTHRPPSAPIDVDGAPLAQRQANLLHSVIFNLTGHPVVTLPIGTTGQGLPLGVQVVGRRWAELDLLDVAAHIDRVRRGYQRPSVE